jgi:predicted translin family RNA/ssDNA-binding protein
LTRQAAAERDETTQSALREAADSERRFEQRIPEIHQTFLDKAATHADQTLTELKRRYEERHAVLRAAAQEHEAEAVEAALALVLDPEADQP